MVSLRRAAAACGLFILIGIAAAPGAALAAAGMDLYTEIVDVEGRDYAARLAGYREALARVLVRATGRRDIASEPALAPAIRESNRLVLRYGFTAEGRLEVSFDGPAIESLLAENGLPVWSRERPRTLVWLAMDNGAGARTLVGGEEASEAKQFLQQLAAQRGLPLLFPLMDTVDMLALPFADVWGGFNDNVSEASRRYNPDAVLIGRALRDVTGYWVVRWTLMFQGQVHEYLGTIDDGVQVSADWFAGQYAVVAGAGASRALVNVTGVHSLEAYAAVQDYLSGLSMVSHLDVRQATADSVLFELSLAGGREVLRRAMMLNPTLVEQPGAVGNENPDSVLYYRLGQ